MGLEHSIGWAFRTLDGAGTFLGMGIQNTGWCWNIPWDGHSKHWMVLEHSMGWAFKTLDGAGTFHGMGIIGAAIPGTKHRRAIRREVTATLETVSCTMGKVFILYFDASFVDLSLSYEAVLQNFTAEDKIKARYSTFLGRYPGPCPGWSQMMQSVCDGIYPGQSTFLSYP